MIFMISRRDYGQRSIGFTLIELSIVLVIVGLVVSGVLAGKELISTAESRAALGQINQYNAAAYAFKNKYNGLPGDLDYTKAGALGFAPRIDMEGYGDGNGVIEGCGGYMGGCNHDLSFIDRLNGSAAGAYGENCGFWLDLSTAKLIAGDFHMDCFVYPSLRPDDPNGHSAPEDVPLFLPRARIGKGNYFHILSENRETNYFAIAAVDSVNSGYHGFMTSYPGITTNQAYNIDLKTDDGIADTGRTLARFRGHNRLPLQWVNDDAVSSPRCYDDATGRYLTDENGGNTIQCALIIQFN
jgi:prepilin-type N-terminal cleavage/methylation domain-containing protein